MSVEWNERYSVGNRELDAQHRRLFEIFSALLDADGTSQGLHTVTDALRGLRSYTHEHFTLEEKYMVECGYPHLESHRQIHDDFRKKVNVLCLGKSAGCPANLTEILRTLYDWLVTHICTCDQQYAPYLTHRAAAV